MRTTPAFRNRREAGFSYVMLMTAVVLMGLAMSVAARQWKTMVQRELEADLLAKGIEIQRALALYSNSMKAGRVMPGEFYPQTLADLTRQPRPYLRKVYLDPVSHAEWELVRGPAGGIMGVRSKSRSKPIKQREFPLVVRHFEGKSRYYDWVFQHPNPSTAGSGLPTAAGTPPLVPASTQAGAPGGSPPSPENNGTTPVSGGPPASSQPS
ncbi:MAG TPA: hypothetical protein VD738_02740 [Nitrospira sp.]|nr:hypothetical protein [Nitrospira sp.]